MSSVACRLWAKSKCSFPTHDACAEDENAFRQQPQCEGRNAGRYLFTTDAPTRGYHRYHHRDGQVILEAGQVHGVVENSLFDLSISPDSSQAPVLRGLIATQPGATQTRLHVSPDHPCVCRVPTTGWAKMSRVNALVEIASTHIGSVHDSRSGEALPFGQALDEFVSIHQGAEFALALVYDHKRELMITKTSDGHVVLDVEDELCQAAGLRRLRSSDPFYIEPGCRREIVYTAVDFFHHLRRSNKQHPLRDSIKIKAHLLEDRGGRPVPVGNNLVSNRGILTPEHVYEYGDPGIHQCYGITIVNTHHQPLYFWIFAFNMHNLSIGTPVKCSYRQILKFY
jgi:hypothetical protein